MENEKEIQDGHVKKVWDAPELFFFQKDIVKGGAIINKESGSDSQALS